MATFRQSGVGLSGAMLLGIGAMLGAAPAAAKISTMSGAYDGRGKPPETNPASTKPSKKAKTHSPKPAVAPGGH